MVIFPISNKLKEFPSFERKLEINMKAITIFSSSISRLFDFWQHLGPGALECLLDATEHNNSSKWQFIQIRSQVTVARSQCQSVTTQMLVI